MLLGTVFVFNFFSTSIFLNGIVIADATLNKISSLLYRLS